MTRPPATARVLLLCALSATALPSAACSTVGRPAPRAVETPPPPPPSASGPSTGRPSASPATLTAAQARAALITETDLGEPWVPTQGAGTWRDGLLKATTGDHDCRQLLDVLYTDELLGAPAGPRASSALDDAGTGAQLRYQVAAHRPADVDRTVAWLASLPARCGEFTAVTTRGTTVYGQVAEVPLPQAGDARAGLRVVLSEETADGESSYLTLDAAVVRVGQDAISLTHGGYGDLPAEVAQNVAQLGAQRLADIRQQGRVLV